MTKIVEIKVDALSDMRGRMTKSRQIVIKQITKEMQSYGRVLVAKMKEEAPVREGVLQKSIRFQVKQRNTRGAELVVTAGNKQRPSVVVKTILYGSKPHPIVAKKAPYLHFFWEKKGRWVKTKSVNHPGTNPNNFMERALEMTKRDRSKMLNNIGRISVAKILNKKADSVG